MKIFIVGYFDPLDSKYKAMIQFALKLAGKHGKPFFILRPLEEDPSRWLSGETEEKLRTYIFLLYENLSASFSQDKRVLPVREEKEMIELAKHYEPDLIITREKIESTSKLFSFPVCFFPPDREVE